MIGLAHGVEEGKGFGKWVWSRDDKSQTCRVRGQSPQSGLSQVQSRANKRAGERPKQRLYRIADWVGKYSREWVGVGTLRSQEATDPLHDVAGAANNPEPKLHGLPVDLCVCMRASPEFI